MKIAVSGSHGFLGSGLLGALEDAGHEAWRLVRGGAAGPGELDWDPRPGWSGEALRGFDAVVHLAGSNIAAGRWTPARKREIAASRVDSTRSLARALAGPGHGPRVLLAASATGFYGSRGDLELREAAAAGKGFLPALCAAWEEAAAPAREAGVRVVALRLGMVLGREGGALARMLPLFRAGLGGRLGGGGQWMPWIDRDDAMGAMVHLLGTPSASGAYNLTSPHPVTNRAFTRVLARVLRRPALLPVPAAALRIALGGLADEVLLGSARVLPARLQEAGYRFAYPQLEDSLRHLLEPGGAA